MSAATSLWRLCGFASVTALRRLLREEALHELGVEVAGAEATSQNNQRFLHGGRASVGFGADSEVHLYWFIGIHNLMEGMMRAFVAAVVLVMLLSVSSAAQDNSQLHHHESANMIDGATHPELIPDLTAYRLFLVMVSRPPVPTDDQRRHQDAQLGKIGLQDADRKSVVAILSDFDVQYQALINAYNEEATADWARGERPDIESMRLQRDQLVQQTHDRLRFVLSGDGWARLDAHVQGEKRRMKISVPEVQQ